jgi:hypothetical protein
MKVKKLLIPIVTILVMTCGGCNKEVIDTPKSEKATSTQLCDNVVPAQSSDNAASTQSSQGTSDDINLSDPKIQQIIDNNDFLTSFEGTQYQISSFYFARAFLKSDYDYIKENLLDQSNLEKYDYKKQLSDIECMVARMHKYDKQNQTVNGEYMLQISKDDSFFYLEFTMKLVDGKWKIVDYQVDA